MQKLRSDWVIVGGGPAGAMTARELAKAGREVLCLQRKLDFRKPCGGGVRMDAFERFDLSRHSILHRIGDIGLHHKRLHIEIPLVDTELAIVERRDFDNDLRQKAASYGAQIREGTFRALEKIGSGYRILATNGGEAFQIQCRKLIAADGVYSPIRRQLTGSLPSSRLTRYLEVKKMPGDPHSAHFHFGWAIAGRGYSWDFPGAGGRHLGTLGSEENLRRCLRELGVVTGEKLRGYPIPRYENPLFHREGICFVGDAAGQVLPFTYEGIYYALASAELLVATLLAEGNPEAYAHAWKERFGEKFAALKRLERLFLADNLRIALMMRLYRNPSVRRAMLKLWLTERYSVPSGWHLAAKILKKAIRFDL